MVKQRTRPVRSTYFAVFVAVLLAVALAPSAHARQGDDEAAQPTAAAPDAPEHLASPRQALAHFFLNADDSPAVASEVFDLSQTSATLLSTRRERLPDDLMGILDRTEVVDLDDVPGEGDPALAEGEWTYRRVLMRGLRPVAPVILRFERQGDGGWRLDADTVERIPVLYEEVKHLPVLESLRDKSRPVRRVVRDAVAGNVPDALRSRGFLLEHWQWIGIALIVFLAAVLDRLSRFLARLAVQRVIGSVKLDLGADVRNFVRPVGIFVGGWAFLALLWVLELEESYHATLRLAAQFVLTVAGVWSAYRLVDLVCGVLADRAARTRNKFDDVLVPLMRRTLKILVVVVAALYVTSIWTDTLWQVLASVSVGSIALTFAAKDSIENLFGTFTVLLDKPFQLGDWIVVGDIEGTVEQVGFRSTRVRTFYNSLISVPNSKFISSHVDNMGSRRYRRVKATLGLTYDTPPEKVEAFCEGVRELIRTHPYTRKDYYHVYFNGYGPSSLDVLLYAFFDAPDWATELREKHRLFADILRVANRLGVEFAFPTQSIHVVKPEDLVHEGAPPSIDDGLRAGREAARATTEETLAGLGPQGPPPPSMEGPDPDWRLGE